MLSPPRTSIRLPTLFPCTTRFRSESAPAGQKRLQEDGIAAAVVSLPCWALFDAQPAHYRDEVLGTDALKIAIEAASTFGWERYVGADGAVIGMTGFGASAPAADLYRHFGITADAEIGRAHV